MATLLIILALLVLPYFILAAFPPLRLAPGLRGRIGLALVFFFTGAGHFIVPREMATLIPPAVQYRVPIIYITGVIEIAAAAALLIPRLARPVGLFIIAMLIGLLPFNIYGAVTRAPFGGHAWGPVYLLLRVPLQAVLIAWAYCFAVRAPTSGAAGREP